MVPEMLFHDYGIGIDAIADNLILATNQVLVKRVCPKCTGKLTFDKPPEWFSLLPYPNKDEAAQRLAGKQVRAPNPEKQQRALMGQLLLNAGVITEEQLEEAINSQRASGKGQRLGTVLMQLGHTDEKTIERAMAEQKNICSCVIRYENSAISSGYIGRTALAECILFTPQMFEDGNISVTAMDKKTKGWGNILDDAIEKIEKGMIDVDALWRLI
jgi:type II secretory ATPase GspE/PulE/Tfp pilus assembly ATPase PilB-like protein